MFAVLLAAFSCFAFKEAYAISGFSGLTTGGVLPMIASGIMVVCAAINLIDVLFRRAGAGSGLLETAAFLVPARLGVYVVLLSVYVWAIPVAGFISASGVFLFASILMLWSRGILWAAGVSLIAMLVVYVLFRLAFQVVLPVGTLWQ